MPRYSNTPETFWSRVDKSGECWLWQGHRDPAGYGVVHYGGKPQRAHRVAWLLSHGSAPGELLVLHCCDNPACVRPDHLFLGTQADNMADKVAKGRQAKGDRNGARTKPERHARGERGGTARLTAALVGELRRAYDAGEGTQMALAARFGIDQTTVSLIVRRKLWRHVKESRAQYAVAREV